MNEWIVKVLREALDIEFVKGEQKKAHTSSPLAHAVRFLVDLKAEIRKPF